MSRNPGFGSQKMELFDYDTVTNTIGASYGTLNAQSGTSMTGVASGRAQFSFTQTDLKIWSTIQDKFIDVDTSPVELPYEDATIERYYLGADKAITENKVLAGVWYGPTIRGDGTRPVICGLFMVSGDTDNLETSAGSAAAAPIQLFPVENPDDVALDFTATELDDTLIDTTTIPLPAGQATIYQITSITAIV